MQPELMPPNKESRLFGPYNPTIHTNIKGITKSGILNKHIRTHSEEIPNVPAFSTLF